MCRCCVCVCVQVYVCRGVCEDVGVCVCMYMHKVSFRTDVMHFWTFFLPVNKQVLLHL